jgi:hypothetical protein
MDTQNELKEKTRLLKLYEHEIQTLTTISKDNCNAQNGIIIRERAIDIIKKELIYAETKYETSHNLWIELDKNLSKYNGIEVPIGLQLNSDNNKPLRIKLYKSSSSMPDTSNSYSPISWGKTLIRKLKRDKISKSTSASISTIATCPSTISRSSSVKGQHTDSDDELIEEEWFHGNLPRIESSKLLSKKGDFLVRKTEQNQKQCFVVSVLWNGYRHFIINVDSQV